MIGRYGAAASKVCDPRMAAAQGTTCPPGTQAPGQTLTRADLRTAPGPSADYIAAHQPDAIEKALMAIGQAWMPLVFNEKASHGSLIPIPQPWTYITVPAAAYAAWKYPKSRKWLLGAAAVMGSTLLIEPYRHLRGR